MSIHEFDLNHRAAFQGDLAIVRLTDVEADTLAGIAIKEPERGSIRLLEGEVTGHYHEIVLDRDADEANAEAAATAAIEIAKARAKASKGTAILYRDESLASSLPWLTRTDLIIGFLLVSNGPVILRHPEHDAIRLPKGAYYVGRQVESAGADERIVAD